MAIADYLETKLLDHITGHTAYTQPASLKLALFTADPTDANTYTVNEVGGSGSTADTNYLRQTITFAAASATTGTAASSSAVTFAAPSGTTYTVTHIGIFEAATNNLMFYGPLSANIGRATGKTLVFDIGAVTLSLA